MVREIIEARPREPVTVEHMARYFPEDFELGADDLAPFTAEPKEVFIAPPPPSALGDYIRGEQEELRTSLKAEFDPNAAAPESSHAQGTCRAGTTHDLSAVFARLNPKNDKHWMLNGQPQLDFIRQLANAPTITAAEDCCNWLRRQKPPEPQKFTAKEINAGYSGRIK